MENFQIETSFSAIFVLLCHIRSTELAVAEAAAAALPRISFSQRNLSYLWRLICFMFCVNFIVLIKVTRNIVLISQWTNITTEGKQKYWIMQKSTRKVAPDGGWGWVATFGVSLVNVSIFFWFRFYTNTVRWNSHSTQWKTRVSPLFLD